MSIFDRYRTNEDDALELAKARAAAARRQPLPTPAPAVSGPTAPRSPTSPMVDPSKGKTPTPKPAAPVYDVSVQTPIATTPADDVDDLARTRAEREKERKAAEEELRLGKQRAVQQTDARAGLAGFGQAGAPSAQLSNVARAQDRTATLALADLDRRQRDEEFQAIQRKAALDDLEEANDVDYNGDGIIAGKSAKEREQADAKGQELESLQAKDMKAYVAANRGDAEAISRAEFESLPPGGLGWPSSDGYFYIVTREDPPRFLKVKASAIGVNT